MTGVTDDSDHRRVAARYDVVVVGGGHNALTAAAYLALAGRSVLVLEQADRLGGATQSVRPFPGMDARLSRYSYLVSLLPREVRDELGLDLRLRRRRIASYTPVPGDPRRGLLIDTADPAATARSFAAVGAGADHDAWQRFGARTARLASALFPTVTGPLPSAEQARALVGERWWQDLVGAPIGDLVETTFGSDLVRGVVATDALIGTFARTSDPSLVQNRCFLYHVIGGGTGDWDVPVGGMGAVLDALHELAYGQASDGEVPGTPPLEVYCHSLTDPSILGPHLRATGHHTLTLFGLHLPARLFRADPDRARDRALAATLASLDSVLAEPIEDCLAADADGRPCLEVRSPVDLERELGLPGGHIFHRDLAWPWAPEGDPGDGPGVRWGVATGHEAVLLCGAGARRGGGVSAIPGRSAAMAVLGR